MEQTLIKPCHIFNHHGRWHVINIEGMSSVVIDDETAGIIKQADVAAVLDPRIKEKLTKPGL
ncbi:MAG: hypothetical protein ABRQ39_22980, partial [Candidatus Eremiobacterota bacterium]